jgi:hypothetical protein
MEPHPYGHAFAARDLDRLAALLADDVVLHAALAVLAEQAGPRLIAAVNRSTA